MICSLLVLLGTFNLLYKCFWSNRKMSFKATYSLTEGRSLGVVETFCAKLSLQGHMNLANCLIIHSRRKLLLIDIKNATRPLFRHAALRAGIVDNGNNQFEFQIRSRRNSIPVEETLRTDWLSVMEEQIATPFKFDTNQHLWRLVYLPNATYESKPEQGMYEHESVVIFIINHAIIDGASYTRLFAEFLHNLDTLLSDEPLEEKEEKPFLPPVEFYCSKYQFPSWKHAIIYALIPTITTVLKFVPNFVRGKPKRNAYIEKFGVAAAREPSMKKATSFLTAELSKEETSMLLDACKRANCTVQGAIQAATGMAIAGIIGDTGLPIESVVTANIRPLIDKAVPPEHVGAYFAPIMTKLSPSDGSFWQYAKKITTEIHQQIDTKEPVFMMRLMSNISLASIGDLGSFAVDSEGRTTGMFSYTNLGRLSHLDASNFRNLALSARFGCSSEHEMGNLFACNLATFSGKLFWTFTYYKNVTERENAMLFRDETLRILRCNI